MSTLGRIRRRLSAARERLGNEARLVVLVRPESWATETQLDALATTLREVSPTAAVLRSGEAPDPADVVTVLDPDAVVDAPRLREALDLARRSGQPVVGGGSDPLGSLDPSDVLATAATWDAADPLTATPAEVLGVLDRDHVSVDPWWSAGRGDGHLPLAEQRRFRVDLVEQRSAGLREALARQREERPSDVDPWRTWVLRERAPGWYADAVGGGPAYLEALRPLVRDLLDALDPAALPVSARRAAYAAAHGTLEDLALLLDHDGDHPTGLPYDGELVRLPDGRSATVAQMPENWRRIEEVDRVGHARIVHAWNDADEMHLLGVAWTDYTPGGWPEVDLGLAGEWLETNTSPWEDDQVALAVGRAHEDHPTAGFRVDAAVGTALSFVRVRLHGREVVIRPDWRPDPPRGAPRVVGAEVADDSLRLTLDLAQSPADVALQGPRGRGRTGELLLTGVDLPVTTTAFGAETPLPAGRYRVDGLETGVHPLLLAEQPDLSVGTLGVRLGVGAAGRLQVHVGTALTTHERSARGQQLLRSREVARRPRTVLLEAFHGRSAGDNVGPVAESLTRLAPDLDLALVVDDPTVTPPPGVRPVVRRSAQWHDLLHGAAAYVGNAAAPSWWTKPDHQVHLQTWHGTPLKRIGEDRGPGDLQVWRHRRDVGGQAARWDALVSANPLSSTAFRTAFGFEGELLESGYPRNDLLLDPARRDAAAAGVRSALGIGAEQRVVLYAPTWREYAGVRDAKPLHLDAPAVTAALPDTVVLVRGHYNATGSADAFSGTARVVDVTRYPDVAPLFCAADVLVTDYSSVMFDYALLDRPIVLLVPDLEQYRDVERGFYVELEEHAPGDLVRTTDEVVERLRGEDTGAAARAAFREEFCPWDDGRASERLARWLLDRL